MPLYSKITVQELSLDECEIISDFTHYFLDLHPLCPHCSLHIIKRMLLHLFFSQMKERKKKGKNKRKRNKWFKTIVP